MVKNALLLRLFFKKGKFYRNPRACTSTGNSSAASRHSYTWQERESRIKEEIVQRRAWIRHGFTKQMKFVRQDLKNQVLLLYFSFSGKDIWIHDFGVYIAKMHSFVDPK